MQYKTSVPVVETRRPVNRPSLEADVVVPLYQALISGVIMAALAGGVALATGEDVVLWASIAGLSAMAGVWALRLQTHTELLSTRERVMTPEGKPAVTDATGNDGGHVMAVNVGQAAATVEEEQRAQARRMRVARAVAFVDRCYSVGTSENSQGIKPQDRAEYLEGRDLLMRLSVAKWKINGNTKAGWTMAVDRKTAMRVLRDNAIAL